MPKLNLFRKLIILNLVMLIPIGVLYFYSNRTSTHVLATELTQSHTNQLIFFQNQINTNIGLLSLWPTILLQDPDISNLKNIWTYTRYLDLEGINLMKRIQTKLNIQQSSSDFISHIQLYSPTLRRVISVNDVREYDVQEMEASLVTESWQIISDEDGHYMFKLLSVSPYSYNRTNSPNLIIEVGFSSHNIEKMLDQFKRDGRRDPFYYHEEAGIIFNNTANRELSRQLADNLDMDEMGPINNKIVRINGEEYMVHIVYSNTLGWYLIDYIPLSEIMSPIQKTNRLFYISVIGLLFMSSAMAYMLYAQVQVPLKQLIRGFHRLRSEDYTVRLVPRGRTEFSFVFTRFNSMVEQIQELFERVYLEKIHVREARLKQLQSQINPHFFYNCMSFISSMAKLKDTQAVIAMSQNLASYFRYTTRHERDMATIAEEIEFVKHYLEIQKLRKKKLQYTIDLSDELNRLLIPRLLIQPLVENAVLHGVESRTGPGSIRITGRLVEGRAAIIVEDNGKGMDELEMQRLMVRLSEPIDEEMGCGLWNVHNRLHLRYGDDAGVQLSHSELGGLKVQISWQDDHMREQADDRGGASDDRSLTG